MAELYPSDAELNALSGTTDSEQEVLFVTTGESPYYTSFYRMLYRLLDVARRAGDLRVYKDGEMTFGVRAGKFFNGDSAGDYAGASAQSLTNNSTNYVYLTVGGTLSVNTTGFPAPSATPHIPLATIVTSGGEYDHDDITDYRGRSIFAACGDVARRTVEADTAGSASPNVLTSDESGKVLTNEGATEKNYHNLPAASTGLTYTLIVQDADGMRITAASGDTIRLGGTVSVEAGYIDSAEAGSAVSLVAINETEWIATTVVGSWEIEVS